MSKTSNIVTTSLYQKRKKFYTKVIFGNSQKFRIACTLVIYGSFFLLPWINWGDRPAIFFDLEARQFHILWLNFWPQDFMYLAWTLIIAAFSLFLFTTVAGRLWCGFACPQSMWTYLFMWIEQIIEGKPHARKNLDEAPLSLNKILRKFLKHGIWLGIAIFTAITFVSYFYPIKQLLPDLWHLEPSLMVLFWIAFLSYLTYLNAGWLREQVCIYMCPYSRFQSVMYDKDTLVVAYNPEFGEPRNSIKSGTQLGTKNGGCIDCKLCVQVCPTGIDIRDGAQIDCINCGLCIDACDEVMTSVGRPKNLITFTSLNMQAGKPWKLFRPKTIAYSLVLVIMCSLFIINLALRKPAQASIIRDRVNIYRELGRDASNNQIIANDFTLNIANKSQIDQRYKIKVHTPGFNLQEENIIVLAKGAAMEEQFTLISKLDLHGSQPIVIEVFSETDQAVEAHIETRFIFPLPTFSK